MRLSDAEQSAAPLDRAGRQSFIDAVARRLGALPAATIGPGTIARVCRELQRDHLTPPNLGDAPRSPNRR
jgi:hypothetical protein